MEKELNELFAKIKQEKKKILPFKIKRKKEKKKKRKKEKKRTIIF